LGNFRPADDIFEEAALKLYKAYATFGGYEALTVVSEKDVLYFTSLDSVKSALKHICDVKGIYLPPTVLQNVSLMYPFRNYTGNCGISIFSE
jgi:ribonuclease H2 subunit B